MKTVEELINEIADSEELKKEYDAITEYNAMAAFLKKHDCAATPDEFAKHISATCDGEIADDAAESVAGGIYTLPEKEMSILKISEPPQLKPGIPNPGTKSKHPEISVP